MKLNKELMDLNGCTRLQWCELYRLADTAAGEAQFHFPKGIDLTAAWVRIKYAYAVTHYCELNNRKIWVDSTAPFFLNGKREEGWFRIGDDDAVYYIADYDRVMYGCYNNNVEEEPKWWADNKTSAMKILKQFVATHKESKPK